MCVSIHHVNPIQLTKRKQHMINSTPYCFLSFSTHCSDYQRLCEKEKKRVAFVASRLAPLQLKKKKVGGD